jgi:hypothetical protein
MRIDPLIANTSYTTAFVYDGDGKRVIKTESSSVMVYVNKYFEAKHHRIREH